MQVSRPYPWRYPEIISTAFDKPPPTRPHRPLCHLSPPPVPSPLRTLVPYPSTAHQLSHVISNMRLHKTFSTPLFHTHLCHTWVYKCSGLVYLQKRICATPLELRVIQSEVHYVQRYADHISLEYSLRI